MDQTNETCKNTDLLEDIMATVKWWLDGNKDHFLHVESELKEILDKYKVEVV